MPECLICLGSAVAWKPDKPCECNPTIHKKCWNTWAAKSNGECIICRDQQLKKTQLQELLALYEVQPIYRNNPPRLLSRCVKFLVVLIILCVLFSMMNAVGSQKDEL